jgi:hypothetical protein
MKKVIFTLPIFLLSFIYGMAQPATGLNFDGTDDHVVVGNILTASYTKEAWINVTTTGAGNNIVSSGGHAFWAPSGTGQLSAGHDGTWLYVVDPTPLVAGTWYHVAVTYDAATTTMRLYKNGVLVSSNLAVPPFVGANTVNIGAYGGAATFFGSMDEVRIWSRALCQDEIQHNMSCGLNPAGQAGLVALYHFDQGTVNTDNSAITTATDASGNGNNGTLVNFTLNGTTSNWDVGNASGTCSAFAPTTMAGTPGGTVSTTATIDASGYFTSNCSVIARVVPSGATPVAGSVTTSVTIDATVQTHNTQPYVQRHYDIEPATNPATSTGTITLYFTQTEFTDYNTVRGGNPALPTGPADALGIAAVRITQYHGTGTAPGNYTGTAELIDPVDGNIIWNATLNRWEITFDVTSFSGFYLHTSFYNAILPVTLISFSGAGNGAYNKIQWVTSEEINSKHFELERSTDAITFTKAATIQAQTNSSSTRSYSYNDLRGSSEIYYYRLKMVDIDSKFKYSGVISVNGKVNSFVSTYPNPAKGTITIRVSDTKLLTTNMQFIDFSGRAVRTVKLSQLQQPVDISSLNKGVYIIQFVDGSFTKFVKE